MHAAAKSLAASALFCALSCALASPADGISENQGIIDIDLPIVAASSNDGPIRLTARGVIDGADIGFELDLLPNHTARVRSIGAPSDHFVALLAQRYKLPAPALTMIPSLAASVVVLDSDPGGRTDMKFFFFDSGPEERYAEVYINIDLKKQVLEFHEKDEDYRRPILLDLTKGS